MPETDSFEKRIEGYFNALKGYAEGNIERCPGLVSGYADDSLETKIYVERRLAKKLIEEKPFFKKHFSALKHGYVGDKKGLNGIRDVNKNDGKVYEKAAILLYDKNGYDIVKKYNMNPKTIAAIKVVAHDMSLRRLYGLLDKESGIVVLVGIERYK